MTMPEYHDPMARLEAAADSLEGTLWNQGPLPVEVTAATSDASLTLDAWGVLRGVTVADPPPNPAALTATFGRLLAAAQRALQDPAADVAGITLQPRFDPRRPFPSPLERIGDGGTPDFDFGQVEAAVGDAVGEADRAGAAVRVAHGGMLEAITVHGLRGTGGELADSIMAAAVAAAADATLPVRAAMASGSLDPASPVARMLATSPYDTLED